MRDKEIREALAKICADALRETAIDGVVDVKHTSADLITIKFNDGREKYFEVRVRTVL